VRLRAGLVAAVVVVLAATGCGSDEPDSSSSTPSGTGSASPSASAAVDDAASASPSTAPDAALPVPAGTTLTAPGTALTAGTPATVAWQPRQDLVGVVDVTVTALERTTLKRSFTGWKIPDGTLTAAPYFVRATVTNRGETDLGGQGIPLYAADAAGTLVEPTTFASVYKPCRRGTFPASFAPGATVEACLVYFLPGGGQLSGVTFRPSQDVAAITWTGEVTRARKG
jgi:hypothetical protein